MAWSITRDLLAAVLTTLLASPAPPPSLERSYQEARALYDRGENPLDLLNAALARAGDRNAEITARLRILRAMTFNHIGEYKKTIADALPELPPPLRESNDAVDRLIALTFASTKLAKYGDADVYLEQARALATKAQPKRLAEVFLIRAILSEEPRSSERDARNALRAVRDDDALKAKILGTLGNIAAAQEHYGEAIDFAQQASRLAAKRDATLAHRSEGNLGWYYNELGDRETAEEHLRKAIEIATRVRADDNRIVYLLQLGESEMSRGDLEGARHEFTVARELATKLDSKHTGAVLQDLAEVTFLGHDIAGAAALNAAARQRHEKAKDIAPALRSRILDARIALAGGKLDQARDILTKVSADAETKSQRWTAESWLAQVYAARNENAKAGKHFKNAIETADDARQEVHSFELRLSVADLATQLYDAYIDFLVSQNRAPDALKVAELNRARTLAEGLQLDPQNDAGDTNQVALSYHLGRARSFLWVITPAGVVSFILPPQATIERAVDDYQKAIAHAAPSARGEELYRMLIAPAANALRGVQRLAIIPDGRLSTLNFETLVVPSSHKYWIEDMTIETAPSLRLLSRRRDESKRATLLLVVNAKPADPAFPPLRFAEKEMQSVQRHFAGATTLLAGARATPANYLDSAPETYAFVHFVAHGVATRQRPLDSAVILSSDGDDYKLYARDILAHRLKARLVTISSCHGAGRRSYQGEGLVGLAWAFLRAGAHEVIAALWEVNDRATPPLMDDMYAAIRAGRDPVDALRLAKLKLVHSAGIYRKPFYWAPFVVYAGS